MPLFPLSLSQTPIGFIGTGVMGASMAGHLLKQGASLFVHSRTASKAKGLLEQGAKWCEDPSEIAAKSHLMITMVGYPEEVRALYLGEKGLIEGAKAGSVLCDMSTSEPSLAMEIHQKALERGVFTLDAPVSGGDKGAREATLSIMVGGDEKIFEGMLPLFRYLGKNIVYMGPAGSGQHTKMCNQIAIAGMMMAMVECLRYARAAGLDQATVLQAISKGAAGSWTLDNLAPRILQQNFGPGFFLKHFVKDMAIGFSEGQKMGLSTPVLEKTLEYYRKALEAGYGDLGTHGLYKAWEEHPDW